MQTSKLYDTAPPPPQADGGAFRSSRGQKTHLTFRCFALIQPGPEKCYLLALSVLRWRPAVNPPVQTLHRSDPRPLRSPSPCSFDRQGDQIGVT